MINLIIELNQGPIINELSNQSEIGHKLICQTKSDFPKKIEDLSMTKHRS